MSLVLLDYAPLSPKMKFGSSSAGASVSIPAPVSFDDESEPFIVINVKEEPKTSNSPS
jgi:hypothetical protein